MLLANLKNNGEAPQWMDEIGYKILQSGYLLENETPKQMYSRVASAAGNYYEDADKWSKKFFEVMWKNWLCPSSPILSNFGTNRGLPISCDSIHIGDSIDSIFKKIHELAILSKSGAGVGIYMGDVRGRGADISGNGKSEGIIPFAKCFDSSIVAVSQGSTRRGAAAVYIPMEHADIEEFIQMRKPTGDVNRRCMNLNHGICITDKWMEEMLAGDQPKRQLWESVLDARVTTGEPYLFFTDNVNKQNPECYKQRGLDVKTSNICCLSGDTLVLTSEGPKPINSLVSKSVKIFDGNNWVNNSSFELRGYDKLTRIHLKDGSYVDSNSIHRWFAASDYEEIRKNTYNLVHTKDVKVGQWLEYHEQKIRGKTTNKKTNGWNQVVKIENLEGIHPVYCPNLPTTGKFALANGLISGNTEIFLHTDPDHSFVCCLSSMNLVKWEEWKDTDAVDTAIRFLDAVLQEYIVKSENVSGLEASRRSAIKGRAVGLGVLGWHTLLQKRMTPFDSFDAMMLNAQIFSTMKEQAEGATRALAKELGEPEWCKGNNRRNTHLLAVAPTVSNSTISGGHSAGIEPIAANIFSMKSAKGTFIKKNSTLESYLDSIGKNTEDVWKSINEQSGSVQHLKFLGENEKAVFLTAREINQYAIIKQAAQRQKFIDQGQSVNLFFAANSDPKYIHGVHILAWQTGLKSLYYFRTEGVIKGDLASRSKEDCSACEG